MDINAKVALIALPLDSTKKKYDLKLASAVRLNFGLLALATYLDEHGVYARVFDPQVQSGEGIGPCLDWLVKQQPQAIGLSCISGFSYGSLKTYAKAIREQFPEALIFAGGQDHVGKLQRQVLEDCPDLDAVVCGEGEIPTLALIETYSVDKSLASLKGSLPIVLRSKPHRGRVQSGTASVSALSHLKYNLYEDARKLPASIEVARGCPHRCKFCSNGNRKYIKKSAQDIVQEAYKVVQYYQREDMSIYFQAPFFNMTKDELINLRLLRNKKMLSFNWRAQTRVDSLNPDDIPIIKSSGCAVIDLGFESASSKILLMMSKTNKPDLYLKRAREILHISKEEGLIVKLNILFYAGEDYSTLLETFDFLETNSDAVHSISAYPLLIFPGTKLEEQISSTLEDTGGSVNRSPEWEAKRIYPVNSCCYFTYELLQEVGTLWGKSFQTLENYYRERKHGYFAPGTTWEDIRTVDISTLPCSAGVGEMLKVRAQMRDFLEQKGARRAV